MTSHSSAPATTFAYDFFRIDRQSATALAADLQLTRETTTQPSSERVLGLGKENDLADFDCFQKNVISELVKARDDEDEDDEDDDEERKKVKAGESVTYTIAVKNLGPRVSNAVKLDNDLPNNTSFVNATTTRGSCTTPPHGGDEGSIKCNLGDLTNGETATVTITVKAMRAPRGTRITNVTKVTSTTYDPNKKNNSKRTVTDLEP
jgi:uncharacterized repeat protein (TIGR01451 family)